MDADTVRSLARELEDAERQRQPIEQFSARFPGMTIADAYAIQRAWVNHKIEAGGQIIGHKIGLTSRAMQLASQIDEPDYGTLLAHMLIENGAEIAASDYLVPRVEAEFAFVLSSPLVGPEVTLDEVMESTQYVVPALELIDARIEIVNRRTGQNRKVLDTISDNAANAAIVLGSERRKPHEVDWRWAGALVYKNSVVEESGLGGAVLDHPAAGVAWLANKLAVHGKRLESGEIVLGGSFIRPIPCAAGDVIRADYDALGDVSVLFR
ncbi:MAG: 2-oxo-hept-4-ene-1,7-dioate hydratase [Pseudomonadota bacterium]